MKVSPRALVLFLVLAIPSCGKSPSSPTPVAAATTTTSTVPTTTSTTVTTTSTTTTSTAPSGVTQFNGAYAGTFRGNYSGVPVSGPVDFTVNNGALTVTNPTDGTGRVDSTGAASFGGTVTGLGTTCAFTGTFTVAGLAVTATGTWTCGTSGSGTWTATH